MTCQHLLLPLLWTHEMCFWATSFRFLYSFQSSEALVKSPCPLLRTWPVQPNFLDVINSLIGNCLIFSHWDHKRLSDNFIWQFFIGICWFLWPSTPLKSRRFNSGEQKIIKSIPKTCLALDFFLTDVCVTSTIFLLSLKILFYFLYFFFLDM